MPDHISELQRYQQMYRQSQDEVRELKKEVLELKLKLGECIARHTPLLHPHPSKIKKDNGA